jgi:hypothetical protein
MRPAVFKLVPGASRRGFALITVLLVLVALLVLCAPFLMTARNASKAGAQFADRAQARLALDAAVRHARGSLGRSHPAVDVTPYFDDEEEVRDLPQLDTAFIDTRNDQGVMWQVEIDDVAASIDLNSASPQLFANLLGAATYLVAPVKPDDKELSVGSAYGLMPTGFVWIGRELIGYGEIDGQKLKKLMRGVAARTDEKGDAKEAGPVPPTSHAIGAVVIDQRAFAPVMWRSFTPDGKLREFDAPEQVRDSAQLALGLGTAPPDGASVEDVRAFEASVEAFVAPMLAHGTTYAGVRGGRQWQRPVRVFTQVVGGETGVLRLDEARWFSPGSTVEITDGQTTELGIVQGLVDGGIRLMEPLKNDYFAFTAELRVLARRPVNVNLASPEVLEVLFDKLQVRGRSDRITRDEARDLAALVVESRPFLGMEDFLRRVVLPAAGLEKLPPDAPVFPTAVAGGAKIIDPLDAEALYRNALNSNDSHLAYSTLPFSFTTRDVFDLDVRAVVNAPSGVERVSMVRNQVEMIVPQRDLMQVFARQEDFDELFRIDREAPFWATGPESVQRWDDGATPPSDFVPNFGTLGGQAYLPGITQQPQPATSGSSTTTGEPPAPEHVFASREETGWAQLWASREPDSIAGLDNRHVMHFDHETRDPEGRMIASDYVQRATNDVSWTAASNQLLRAFNLSFWFRPRDLARATAVDIGRTSLETDRATLFIDGNDLVLRVLDAGGDHPDSAGFTEAGEARFSLAPGTGPGLAQDTWSHVSIDVRGTRPSQISMLVDGRAFGVRTPGLTRLTGALSATSTSVQVESTEGFPDPCVIRIGRELIECSVGPGNSFTISPGLTGTNAGFGGRLARVQWQGGETGAPAATNVNTTHASGTPVELYGYAAILASNVPSGSANLPSALGKWAVARALSVVGGASSQGDPIAHSQILFPLGFGIDANSQATGLVLTNCDAAITPADVMKAFSPTGGYAALIQLAAGQVTYDQNGQPTQSSTVHTTPAGAPLFGVEVIKYSGWSGTTLNLVARAALPAVDTQQTAHAFVVEWNPLWQSNGVPIKDILRWQTFVVPISIPAPGASTIAGFLGTTNGSEFAQITHKGSGTDGAEYTEWVRYDTLTTDGHLVRNDRTALGILQDVCTLGDSDADIRGGVPGGGGGGNGGNPGPIGAADPSSALAEPPVAAMLAPAASSAPRQASGGYLWQAYWGTSEDTDLPLTRAARTQFQFRGVCGTHTHEHASGTLVLPVWRVQANGLDGGEPGRFDFIVLMEEQNNSASSLGWPARVHRTWRPLDHTTTTWVPDASSPLLPAAGQVGTSIDDPLILARNGVMVALEVAARAPVGMTQTGTSATPNYESRTLSRALKHPSGERPREVDRVLVGRTIRSAEPFDAVADEIVFHSTKFGDVNDPTARGGQLLLTEDFPDGSQTLKVAPKSLRLAWGDYSTVTNYVATLPQDAGLLRIGSEILCYDSYDADSGTINVPANARGLLGTISGAHELGESVVFLEQFTVSVLTASVGAGDATLPLNDVTGFPPGGGVVIVGDELIHYTRALGSALDMPRRSSQPGKKDHKGDGVFRGRFGTTPAAHLAGTPVLLFPYRYSDRWTEKSDAPELGYFSVALDQPNAFWRTAFWTAEEPGSGQVKLEVLQRTTRRGIAPPPWDGEPGVTKGLELFSDGMPRGAGNPIARQADLVEWRVHARFAQGAFDALTGLSHGWKQTPRLRAFGTEYMGPSMVLRRVGQ